MQKHVNLVDLVKSFPTNIFLQKLASIQKITSPLNFAHLAEKSEKGSTSNLSTKVQPPVEAGHLRGEERSAARIHEAETAAPYASIHCLKACSTSIFADFFQQRYRSAWQSSVAFSAISTPREEKPSW